MAIRSMTAFAHRRSEFDWGSLTWELRSVNHRYLDVGLKLPEAWRCLEPTLRDGLRRALQRGKVEVALRVHAESPAGQQLVVNETLAQTLIETAEKLSTHMGKPAAINPLEILQWPGVLQQPEPDTDTQQQAILKAFRGALDELQSNRSREGAELAALIQQRLAQIREITASLRKLMPDILAAQRQKLQQRLADLRTQLDPDRLEAEIALLAQKMDVDEELDRLDTHVSEVERVLGEGGPCGRRLDFLMQELNREANTLSSKAVVTDSTQAAVELKVLIEQMREQIQNIE